MYDNQNTDELPLLVKNKPKEQQEAFVKAFNSAILKGLTEDEAMLSGTSAMAILAKRNAVINKQDFSTRKRPSHVPDIAVIKALREQEAQALIQEEIEKQRLEYVAVPSYLGKSLPKNKDRNVIAANFDNQDRFVILFDTGEQLVSKSMAIKEYVEQYVSVSMKGSSASALPGDVQYSEYLLSGLSTTILATEHLLNVITSCYILKQDGSEITLDVQIDANKNITVLSLIPMTNFTLYLTGIKA